MDRERFLAERRWIQNQLKDVADFWLKNGMDPVHGGVYTCLDRKGKVYSTDKSVWMQGRCGWTYAYLCHVYGVRKEWLDASRSCLDFLEKYCVNREAGGRLYFMVTEDGKPLRQRRYCFSEAFYCIANAEYYGITGEKEYLLRARRAYDLYWNLNHGMPDPTGMGPKTIPETRSGRALGIPMIILNVTGVMKRVDPEMVPVYDARAKECVGDIFKAAPHNGARIFGERFWHKGKCGKCGNTLCISHFSHCTIGAKDSLKTAAPIVRCCLNIAEIELSALGRQCLGTQRIPDLETLKNLLVPWAADRNLKQRGVSWHFTTDDARTKLRHLYPLLQI